MQKSIQLIKELSLAKGPSGYETEVTNIIERELKDFGQIKKDKIGNTLFEIKGTSSKAKKLLFASHQDEIGFMISHILDNGLLRFVTLGGWNVNSLSSTAVDIINSENSVVFGVIGQKPIHFQSQDERPLTVEELFIDIGAKSKEDVINTFGINIGNVATPHSRFVYDEKSQSISCKAFDDRLGVAIMVELAKEFAVNKIEDDLIFAFTVQEEVGLRGAKVLSNYVEADYAIIVEGSPADDFLNGEGQTKMGGGAHLRIYDPSHIGSPPLISFFDSVAAENKIPVQKAVRRKGGTDAANLALSQFGLPSIVCGVAVRYAHTPYSISSLDDYFALKELLKKGCLEIGKLKI